MKALVLRDDTEAAVASAQALMDRGFQVVCVENRHIARALLRIEIIDVLVLDERIDGRLTHSIALSAERQNPYISAILMTDRPASEVEDLHDLLPCVYALMGTNTAPAQLGTLAISSIENYEAAEARVNRNKAMAFQQDKLDALIAQEEAIVENDPAEDELIIEDSTTADIIGPPAPTPEAYAVDTLVDTIVFAVPVSDVADTTEDLSLPLRANKDDVPFVLPKESLQHSPAA